MKDQRVSLDRVSTLPQNIIETILCLVPIQDAVRTSILSRKWRYNWVTIPKLEFIEKDFEATTDEYPLSIVNQLYDKLSKRKWMSPRCKIFYAIYQVLLVHRGPIHEFILSMEADKSCVEIDQIILHLSRNCTVNKLKLDLIRINSYRLTSLILDDAEPTTEAVLRIISGSPLVKSVTLATSDDIFVGMNNRMIADLFKCLPLIEHITIDYMFIKSFADDTFPRELPTSLVHLKPFCFKDVIFGCKFALPFLVLLIRCSPNLEKIYIPIYQDGLIDADDYDYSEIEFIDYSDICLEHLNELEIKSFSNFKPEMEFVKLVLAKSPVLKKVSIVLYDEVAKDDELNMLRTLLRSPRASLVVDIIVERPRPRG